MLGLDSAGKGYAYSNLIQTIKSKSTSGFIPNYAAGLQRSDDRSEPPVGSRVLLELYKKHGDRWIVDLLFDDLKDWNDWFERERILPPLRLITLGSKLGLRQAKLESGLDNSPMC